MGLIIFIIIPSILLSQDPSKGDCPDGTVLATLPGQVTASCVPELFLFNQSTLQAFYFLLQNPLLPELTLILVDLTFLLQLQFLQLPSLRRINH